MHWSCWTANIIEDMHNIMQQYNIKAVILTVPNVVLAESRKLTTGSETFSRFCYGLFSCL